MTVSPGRTVSHQSNGKETSRLPTAVMMLWSLKYYVEDTAPCHAVKTSLTSNDIFPNQANRVL